MVVLGAGVLMLFGVEVLLAVALGAVLDHWMPEVRSLPHAARLIRG